MLTTLGHQAPRVLGAIAILIIGFFLASVVQNLVTKLLKNTSVDNKLSGFVGGEGAEDFSVEDLLGNVAKYIVLLLAVVAALDALGLTMIAAPLNALSGQVLAYLPKILGAALLLVVAWVLATGC